MFDHNEVVIRANGKVGPSECWVMGTSFAYNVRKEIQEAEDKEIFRILDLIANNGEYYIH